MSERKRSAHEQPHSWQRDADDAAIRLARAMQKGRDVMSDRKRIAFEHIRAGDTVLLERECGGITRTRSGEAVFLSRGVDSDSGVDGDRWVNNHGATVAHANNPVIYLLDRPEPSESVVPVGTAGYATVWGEENVRVMRTDWEDHSWESASQAGSGRSYSHKADEISDFRPDVVLTEEAVQDLSNRLIVRAGMTDLVDAIDADEALGIVREWAARLGVQAGGAG